MDRTGRAGRDRTRLTGVDSNPIAAAESRRSVGLRKKRMMIATALVGEPKLLFSMSRRPA